MAARIPVFEYKKNPQQVGNGAYHMTACFCAIGVHVDYIFYAHSGNEYLEEISEPTVCDGSCEGHPGQMRDFSEEPHHTRCNVSEIVKIAMAFAARNKK